MRERLGTATGRGLLAARTGEIIVLVAAIWFLVGGLKPWILVLGVLVAGAPGLLSTRRIWVGRFEFGPEHEKSARRGVYAFAAASILLVLALLSFQTFPSTSLGLDLSGDNETVDETRLHRFKDLVPPLVMLGAAISTELVSGSLVLWNLVGADWKKWVYVYMGFAGGGVAVISVGLGALREFEGETGRYVDSSSAANFYYDRFLDEVLVVVAALLVVTRVVALALLGRAVRKVAEAEKDEPQPANAPASSP
ncbi:MAG: hypothetical protein HYT80_00355 [Euryarchaeota archaeon]|nr:hypothetical protein [Euryarchaeota archaeon]